MLRRGVGVLLGGVFVIAGAAKCSMMETFTLTVSGITLLPDVYASPLALGIIGAELVGGLALCLGIRMRLAAITLSMLVGLFMWILSAAIAQGKEITCNCFGVLPLHLTNTQEFLFDLVLLNGLLSMAWIALPRREFPGPGVGRRFGVTVALSFVLVCADAFLVAWSHEVQRTKQDLHIDAALAFAEGQDAQFAGQQEGTRVLLLMHYPDLNCPLCLDDFLALTDSLRTRVGEDAHRIVVVFRDEPSLGPDAALYVRRWTVASGIPFPVFVAPDSVFGKVKTEKSMVAIVDRVGGVVFAERFPMGPARRSIAVQACRPLQERTRAGMP